MYLNVAIVASRLLTELLFRRWLDLAEALPKKQCVSGRKHVF